MDSRRNLAQRESCSRARRRALRSRSIITISCFSANIAYTYAQCHVGSPVLEEYNAIDLKQEDVHKGFRRMYHGGGPLMGSIACKIVAQSLDSIERPM